MPENFALYVLLVIALGLGFVLGRRERRRGSRDLGMVAEDYFKGLNHLLNERHDQAIDTFVESMAVDNDTVDTHLALGSLVRRRGEVDKAIRIHQNLLARPVLSAKHRAQSEMELARDYLVAGLLDRAENLLIELTGKRGAEKQVAQELLLEIYQREKEWEKAVRVGQALARQDKSVRPRLAHFQCEIAELQLAAGDLKAARAALSTGYGLDNHCARLSLVEAQVEFASGRYREVLRRLRKACLLDPMVAPECLELYRQACEERGDLSGYVEFLRDCLKSSPTLSILRALAEQLELQGDVDAARKFVLEQLQHHPSLNGFVTLLEQLAQHGEALPADQLALVLEFSRSLVARQPVYRCRNCGFSSKTIMWQCPSCRNWGSLKPVALDDREAA